MPVDAAALDALATPIAWCDGAGRVQGGNLAKGQRRILIDQGCQFGQGYLLGVPQPLVRRRGGRSRGLSTRIDDGTDGL